MKQIVIRVGDGGQLEYAMQGLAGIVEAMGIMEVAKSAMMQQASSPPQEQAPSQKLVIANPMPFVPKNGVRHSQS